MIMLRIFTVLWLALGIAVAQQFEGQTFTVSLANVTGAQKAYFNIFDSAGGRTTLLNYFSFPNGRRQDSTGVKRAIIYVHGADSNPNQYFSRILAALKKATASNPAVTEQSVALLAPYFSVDARAPAGSNALTWQSDIGFGIRGWSTGRNSVNPTGQPVSSFEVLDQIITYFNDASIYPNLNEVVVAGHSMGAQMLQRYAAVGKVLPLRVPLVYWIGNPSSYAWLNTSRPITSTCATYDDWNQGLSNYDIEYEKEFVETQGVDAVRARYFSRNIAYARGLNDFGDSSKGDCAPFTTGANRGERFNRFQAWFPADDGDTVDYVAGVGHNDAQMTTHASGVARLFLDNFEGDGSRMPNFGTQGPNTRP